MSEAAPAAAPRRWLRALWRTVGHFVDDEGFLLASALSFSFTLCLVPLVLILFAVAGFLLESDVIAAYLLDTVSMVFPAYGEEVATFLGLLARERAVIGVLGLGSLAVFATQLFSQMRRVMNRAFRVERRRGPVHGFFFDLLAVAVLGSAVVVFIVATFVLALVGDLALSRLAVPPELAESLQQLLVRPLLVVLGLGILFLVYRQFPNTVVPARAALVATVVVALLWVAGGQLFGAYVRLFGVYGRLYGSFGVAMATLVWIYVSAAIFVFGGELAAVVAGREKEA